MEKIVFSKRGKKYREMDDLEDLVVTTAPDLIAAILPNLICPVCHTFPEDPQTWCPQGHLLCQDCHRRLHRNVCPICTATLHDNPTKNLTMRQLFDQLHTKCRECNLDLSLRELRAHPSTCLGRPSPCLGSKAFYQYHGLNSPLLYNCTFKAKNISDLLAHNEVHRHSLLVEAGRELSLDRHSLLFRSRAEEHIYTSRTALMNVLDEETKQQYLIAIALNIHRGPVFAIQFYQYNHQPLVVDLEIIGETEHPYITNQRITIYHALASQRASPHVYLRNQFNLRIRITRARLLPLVAPTVTSSTPLHIPTIQRPRREGKQSSNPPSDDIIPHASRAPSQQDMF